MRVRRQYLLAATLVLAPAHCFTQEEALEGTLPLGDGVTASISDETQTPLAGISPYDSTPDQGMRASPDTAALREEIHPQQAAWIGAALGGEPYRLCDHCRAGWPQCIRPRAIPSNTWPYIGYQVGGGAPWHGEPRQLSEGTFGWDYGGILFPKRVPLDWHHGAYQRGTGAYKTDGPKVLHHE